VTHELEVVFLTDGGQPVDATLDRLLAFIGAARTSLDMAIYDAKLAGDAGERVLAALHDATGRGVTVRAVYNDVAPSRLDHPPPAGTPSLLQQLASAVPSHAIPGVPDLMHHKYVVRDGDAVWTGSTNWTTDSWTRMENVIVTAPSTALATAYTRDFEQLWTKGHVERTGTFDVTPAPATFAGADASVDVLFSPGRGEAMSHLVAQRLRQARRRIVICSPVITAGPILATLAELVTDRRTPITVTVDGPQMREVLQQWRADPQAAWKAPIYEHIADAGVVAAKPSTPYGHGPVHDFMHAKVVVADDIVLTGSYNCSHSGERNAENLLEVTSAAFAEQCAAFATAVHDRYVDAT
jgi:phosphatidylserine/phosphatidylglycerophosphate/cardiolipin synthase-like enzyme